MLTQTIDGREKSNTVEHSQTVNNITQIYSGPCYHYFSNDAYPRVVKSPHMSPFLSIVIRIVWQVNENARVIVEN